MVKGNGSKLTFLMISKNQKSKILVRKIKNFFRLEYVPILFGCQNFLESKLCQDLIFGQKSLQTKQATFTKECNVLQKIAFWTFFLNCKIKIASSCVATKFKTKHFLSKLKFSTQFIPVILPSSHNEDTVKSKNLVTLEKLKLSTHFVIFPWIGIFKERMLLLGFGCG